MDQIKSFASQAAYCDGTPLIETTHAEALQSQRGSWRYRRHCFAHHFDEYLSSRCRECIGFGLLALGLKIGLSAGTSFLSLRHSTFHHLPSSRLLCFCWVWQPFCLLSTSSPATCKVISAQNLGKSLPIQLMPWPFQILDPDF